MPDLILRSLRGGMNNSDPAIAIPDDQSVLAENVEYVTSMLGERRLGSNVITLPAWITGTDRVSFLYRHLPTADDADAELWALGVTGTTTAALGYKDTSWHEVTISDTPVLTGSKPYRWSAVTLHGKLHLAYASDQDRLHVWDGTTLRRSGVAQPAAPTVADSGAAGTLAGTRYGRIRYVEMDGTTVVRRSEPSDSASITPDGAHASITWTKPAAISEGETHWEIELSTDDVLFYRASRIAVGTTTYVDSADYSVGYNTGATTDLSEDVGDYALLWSAKYLATDSDRLLLAGHQTDPVLASRVGWTPVYRADGVGNDERLESDTDATLDLDTYAYGEITGISNTVLGANWVFKTHAIYKLTRTGNRVDAYSVEQFSDVIGAIDGSVVTGTDETGQPCVYAIDPTQGPYRIGLGGLRRCGDDVRATWTTLNLDATATAVSALYYPTKKQVIWCLALDAHERPSRALVLHTDKSRTILDGVRKGWTTWTGYRAQALAMCLFAGNIEDNTARSKTLVPFIGLEGAGLVHQCDYGIDEADAPYAATITTKPITMQSILHHFEVKGAALMADAVADAAVSVSCVRDFGVETTMTVTPVGCDPTDAETVVIQPLDAFVGAEMRVCQFTFADVDTPLATWALQRLDVVGQQGQRA